MLDKAYDAKKYEDAIYKKWEKSGAFKADSQSKKKPFCISMPPPNATGTLHLGHAIMLALEDILIRHRRMKGYEALWVPGTDHAAIATQNKVEKLLAEEGVTREQLGRESFLNRVKEYVADSQDIIRNQIRKMGSSCDWERERYTLDDDLNRAVIEVFVRMYEDGLIYRGHRIVNWCTRCGSTLADDEVEYVEVQTPFYYIKYGPVVIGTARPETKFADKVVVVHPEDKRYKKYVGQEMDIDWIDGKIKAKFIADKDAADMEMGTGAMTITPAHSFVDFDLAKKYKLEIEPIIDERGKMLPIAGEFAGMDVAECRTLLVKKMQKLGLIDRIDENYTHNLSVCYRCNTAVEPLVSEQWFIDVNKKCKALKGKSIKQRSIEVVKKGDIQIIPDKFNKTYFHWMEDLRDWCISRQIWWGHRIPVWYCACDKNCKPECRQPIVSRETPKACSHCKSKNLKQDEDTLDTWFSSALWTFSTLGWPKKTADLKKFHPTSVMETGYDILFFWVARMIIMTTYALGDIPFEKVYLHGLIRDREGRKMSKSLNNGIDPLEMIDQFGADALRMSMVIGNTPGNDMRLYEEKIKGYRNFTNKLWNASRFVLGIFEEKNIKSAPPLDLKKLSDSDQWILEKLNRTITSVDDALTNFRISEAGQVLYDFLWSDFCDWCLELSKGEKQNPAVLYHVLKTILILLHPIVPFVTEQIWSELPGSQGMLINEAFPALFKGKFDGSATDTAIEVISALRRMRAENKIEPGEKIPVVLYGHQKMAALESHQEEIIKLARISKLTLKEEGPKLPGAATDVASGVDVLIPLGGLVDTKKEKERLTKEIANLNKYIASVSGKLANKHFLQNAPKAVVEGEKKKLSDATVRMNKMKEQLAHL
ncbi:valine--tRNA ligase [Candidatus Peregrinibacteria bacterium]|nr:valine--tRNA ligase [Candidatus Peregrinibacteria bacterium]